MVLPLLKLGTLALRTLNKPIAARIKKEAGRHPKFRSLIINFAQVGATPDLMLAYIDFFLGGDEKRNDLPLRLNKRFPVSIFFGGDGSYMSPFSLHNDNIITSLMSQPFHSVCITDHMVPLRGWFECTIALGKKGLPLSKI